jgi:hypothetical protein
MAMIARRNWRCERAEGHPLPRNSDDFCTKRYSALGEQPSGLWEAGIMALVLTRTSRSAATDRKGPCRSGGPELSTQTPCINIAGLSQPHLRTPELPFSPFCSPSSVDRRFCPVFPLNLHQPNTPHSFQKCARFNLLTERPGKPDTSLVMATTRYTGLELDDFAKERRRPSSWSRRSGVSLLKHHTRSAAIEATASHHKPSNLTHFWQSTGERIVQIWSITKEDVKSVQWRRFQWPTLCHICALSAIAGILSCLIFIATVVFLDAEDACLPDGTFDPGYRPYSLWATSGIFQITLGFGQFPFSTVKLVDIFWDVVRAMIAI